MRRLLIICVLLGGCAQQPVQESAIAGFTGKMPVDFSGSWERDYSRGPDLNRTVNHVLQQLSRSTPEQRLSRAPGIANPVQTIPKRDVDAVLAMARFAEEITRLDVIDIEQTDTEIRVNREEDFALTCEFYDGVAKGTDSPYGMEVCNWDGSLLVSNLSLPGGLLISHRFAISPSGSNLRVDTTIASSSARVPFTLTRYFKKFERPASDFNCVETLSMKRVCSTGDIDL